MAEDNIPRWGRRSFLKATGIAGLAATMSNVVQATPGRAPGPKRDELLVGVSLGTEMAEAAARIDDVLQRSQRVAHRNDELRYVAVQDPSVATVSAAGSLAGRLRGLEFAKFVEENETKSRPDAVNDPQLDSQYAPQLVNAIDAWNTTQGSENVTIAVIDQGVKYDHPDLQAQFGSDKGQDFVDNDGDPMPTNSSDEYHGTHVAGIASATTDNGVGVAGISDSRLLSARALSASGGGSLSDIADAVQWAADQGADIINMSLGGGGYTDTMKNAVQYAVNNGSLPICAAGNDGSRGVSYPAKYDECVAVGAVDSNENLTSFSQYGPDLDVVAPGQNVLSTSTRSGGYEELPGTSMACPAAAGVAALGLAAQGDMTPSELRSTLKNTAVDVGLSSEKQGSGRVDALNIVGGDGGDGGGGGGGDTQQPTADIAVSPSSPDVGETVTFDGSGSSDPDGGSIESYQWESSTGGTATGSSVEGTWNEAQDVTITLTVTDDEGETDTTSVTVSIGDGGGTEQPVARIDVSPSSPDVGETVTFDGSGSSDPDGGSIESYQWESSTGGTATGSSVEGTWNEAQDVTITLTVTDDEGETDTTSVTVSIGTSDPNEGPTADLSASGTDTTVGTAVDFDGSGSSDPDGSIASYDWAFGDGTTASGATVSKSWDAAGDYTVTLTVTDDAGATDSASTVVSVQEDSGGQCGDNSTGGSASSSLSGWWDDESFSYTAQLSDPCQVEFVLDGPASADFDLYVTLDGRDASPGDYDKRSITQDSQERVLVENVASGQDFGITIDSYSGSGSYTISVEELGA